MALLLPRLRSRRFWWIALAIAVLMVISFVLLSPSQSQRLQGSTYGRSPGDYGAWWTWMDEQNTPVQRWQKSPDQLNILTKPATLLRIDPQAILSGSPQVGLGNLSAKDYQWVSKGNRLVYLGRWASLSAAPFNQTLDSQFGPVTIQGRRRGTDIESPLLSDEHGAIIWREVQGQGDIIWVIPPFLGANAFQEQTANFQLLQALMQGDRHQLWVDEYLHGYKDSETLAAEAAGTVWHYLQQTPLFPLFVQLLLLCGLLIGWGNRRFGRPQIPPPLPANNHQTYVYALAQVLEKGDRPEFVVHQLLQAEAPHLARLLGLDPLTLKPFDGLREDQSMAQSNHSALIQTLQTLGVPLSGSSPNRQRLPQNEKELQSWLKQWQDFQAQLTQALDNNGDKHKKP